MKIVITGGPSEGFEFYGPFPDGDEAVEWAEEYLDTLDWWIGELKEAQYE